MKALVLHTSRREAVVEEINRPSPGPGEVLIRVQAIALNPIDQLFVSSPIAAQETRIIGTDFAGIVVEAGSGLSDSSDARAQPGARVAGFLQGACSTNDRPGAFAEYIVAPYDLIWAVPSGLSLEEASTISMCGLTAAQGLYSRLGLPSPFSARDAGDHGAETVNIFIYGSSTSVGLYAAQLAHLFASSSGKRIRLIGAASASNHSVLRQKPYSYDYLVDYRDPDWIQQVKNVTDGRGVDYAMDCISEGQTVYNTHATLATSASFATFRSPAGGQYDISRLTVEPIYGVVWEGLGAEIGYDDDITPVDHEAHKFAKEFYNFLSKGLPSGRAQLEPNPVRLMPGGLERVVPDGFTLLGSGRVTERTRIAGNEEHMRPISAEKLVYTIGPH